MSDKIMTVPEKKAITTNSFDARVTLIIINAS